MTNVNAILVGKWIVGIVTNSSATPPPTVHMFEFDNREPINLAFPPEEAKAIARSILDQYEKSAN
jgi:hypothetical protein